MASFADLLVQFAGSAVAEPDGRPPSQRTGDVVVFGEVVALALTISTPSGPITIDADVLAALGTGGRFLILPRDPLPADIAAGSFRLVKNTATGRLSYWANDGGAMVDLLTFTPAS